MRTLDITPYTVPAPVAKPYTLALVSDMHNCDGNPVLAALRGCMPDAVIIAGDMMTTVGRGSAHAMRFLADAAAAFPVFYGFGNHEYYLPADMEDAVRATGVQLLINEFARFGELCIGAPQTEAIEEDETRAFLSRFCREDGYRILISHRPEWYKQYLCGYDIPLILSGHAHGGQIRFFGIPIFSPGQGLFPRYAQGMHDGRLIVSRGIGNHTVVPRIGNAPEICIIRIIPCQQP